MLTVKVEKARQGSCCDTVSVYCCYTLHTSLVHAKRALRPTGKELQRGSCLLLIVDLYRILNYCMGVYGIHLTIAM